MKYIVWILFAVGGLLIGILLMAGAEAIWVR